MIHTLGHSTRSLADFLALVVAHGVREVVDVRRYPASRRHPHFAREALAAALADRGIGYVHEPDLGGRRTPSVDSPNTAWRARGFRGYADYMDAEAFRAALDRLVVLAGRLPTAIVCAEAVPWRCHRRLIADALVVRGIEVGHILALDRVEVHRLSPIARVRSGGRLVYPADSGEARLEL